MGKNSGSLSKASGKLKNTETKNSEGKDPVQVQGAVLQPAQNEPPSTTTPPQNAGDPSASGDILLDSLADLKGKVDILISSAVAVQAASLPLHLNTIQAHLLNNGRLLSERESLNELILSKDEEVKTLQYAMTGLTKLMNQQERDYMGKVEEAHRQRDAKVEEIGKLEQKIDELDQLRASDRAEIELMITDAMNLKLVDAKEAHQKQVQELETNFERLQQELEETTERLRHAEAQNSYMVLDRARLMRETERAKRDCLYAVERFDKLMYRQDDTILRVQFDQLGIDIIDFVIKYTRDFDSVDLVNHEKIPKALMKCNFIPLSRSFYSKVLRISWAVTYISKSFLRYLFQPFGQYMNREDNKRIMQCKRYSQYLAAQDPIKEAIWRNLTVQAMKGSGECGFGKDSSHSIKDPSGQQTHVKEFDREDLFQFELDSLLPVMNTDSILIENMRSEFNEIVKTAAEIWVDARRNWEPIEISPDVTCSNSSDWDLRYTEFMRSSEHEKEDVSGNGVPINNLVDEDLESAYISTQSEDTPRTLQLCLFPKIYRVSQGSPVVIHAGIGLFDGGHLYTQGEEEVAEERMRILEQQKLRRKKNFGQSHSTRRSSTAAAGIPSPREAFHRQQDLAPMVDIDTAAACTTTVEFSCNFSNNSGISTTESSLIDISGGTESSTIVETTTEALVAETTTISVDVSDLKAE